MKRFGWIMLGMLHLSMLNGSDMWVDRDSVVYVAQKDGYCSDKAATHVQLISGFNLCVKDSAWVIADAINTSKSGGKP